LERATCKVVACYPAAAVRKEPPTHQECADLAWVQAVADAHVEEKRRADYEILIAQEFGYTPDTDLWPMTLLEGARSAAAVADAGSVRNSVCDGIAL
jgi:hypothetical protein